MADDVLGWIGAFLVLGAYGLVALGRLPPSSRLWAAMNVAGAASLATAATLDGDWPFVTLNAVWVGIGLASWAGARPKKAPLPGETP